jgi:holin-like protein
MIHTFALLLLYQLGGEVFVRLLGLPVSGPVVGMLLFLLTLLAKGGVGRDTRENVGALLRHMSLLFIPASVGIMVHLGRVIDEWLPIAVSLVVSTFLGMAVTAWVIRAMTSGRTNRTARNS